MPDRLSVLFVIPTLRRGGAERVFANLLQHMDRDRFRVSLAVVDTSGSAFTLPGDVEVIDLGRRRVLTAIPALVRLIRQKKPDVVFSTLDHLSIALAMTRFAWPREVAFAARLATVPEFHGPAMRQLLRVALPLTDGVVAQSSDMETSVKTLLGSRRLILKTLPNPVQIPLSPRPRAEGASRSATLNFVAAGRLSREKAFDVLLDAIALADLPDVKLRILGDGPDRQTLESQRDRLGLAEVVEFVGFQDQPLPFFAEADAYVLSSPIEGFPNVVLESLACGTPVVVTPVSGMTDLLGPLASCQIAAGSDKYALADALRKFAAGSRERIPPGAIDRFDARNAVKEYEAMLTSVAASRASRRSRPNQAR